MVIQHGYQDILALTIRGIQKVIYQQIKVRNGECFEIVSQYSWFKRRFYINEKVKITNSDQYYNS